MSQPKTNDSSALRETAAALGLQFRDEITETDFAPELTASLPLAWARSQLLLPARVNGRPVLFTSTPTDIESEQKAALTAGCRFTPIVAPPRVIAAAIEKAYAQAGLSADATTDAPCTRDTVSVDDDAACEPAAATASFATDLLASSDDAPVTRLVNRILLDAVKQRASDIHFEPFENRLTVRYRIDGVLYSRPEPPKSMEAALVSRLKVMAGMDIAERRLPQDGMAQASIGDKAVDIRVSTVPVADGERVVLRLLNRDDTLLPMTSLGMDANMLESFRTLLRHPNGIIIVSGPTGSGKTTTLYSALREIDSKHRNVLTIEDPVEYRLSNIGQIQVKPKIGLTFATGLRHILRQDPDVVLVGETRDAETAEIAVRASLTGHLVFTTLHTNDAPSAVTRLTDMGIPPYLLASSLRGVLGQRLVRALCPCCARETTLAEAVNGMSVPESWLERLRTAKLKAPVGCERCIDGYIGRTAIFEFMSCSPEIRSAIRRGDTDLRRTAIDVGMKQFSDDALQKAAAGITDLTEIYGAIAE